MTGVTRPPMRRLVLIDDHQVTRDGLRAGLERVFEIVADGATGAEARALTVEFRPDVLVLDVELGGEPAAVLVRAIRRDSPETAVVIVTMFEDSVLRRQLLNAGAADYLTKATPTDVMAQRIQAAQANDGLPSTDRDGDDSPPVNLSNRELEVLRLIAAAASNRDIGARLHIAEGTVKRHTNSIYAKLEATSRIDAVQKAVLLGVIAR